MYSITAFLKKKGEKGKNIFIFAQEKSLDGYQKTEIEKAEYGCRIFLITHILKFKAITTLGK